ncbi:MAG: class I SAM-dependent methyltransferase family protein [Candidatus Brocadiales bacterium]|nr:class I SAM-dependent methyltransferase family protein [Candidatus Brocadiales bacterium]
MKEINDELACIAKAFENSITQSATATETERPRLTSDAVRSLVSSLTEVGKQVDGNPQSCKEAREHFRECIYDLSIRGHLWHRGLVKPNGYAGDYVLLDSIYRNELNGSDAIGQELDRAFLTSPLAETVRCRKEALVKTLLEEIDVAGCGQVSFIDLACGPCRDVQDVLSKVQLVTPSFRCIDHDPAALQYASEVLGPLLMEDVQLEHGNVLRISGCVTTYPRTSVYSVGLIDYLGDRLASLAIRKWWKLVGNQGILVLTAKDRFTYDPTFYDWMADWKFVPRTEKNFVALLLSATGCSPKDVCLSRDKTGVSIQGVIKKRSYPKK